MTDQQVNEIRRRVAIDGIRQNVVAAEFGVSPQTINHIIKGRTWAADEIRLVQD